MKILILSLLVILSSLLNFASIKIFGVSPNFALAAMIVSITSSLTVPYKAEGTFFFARNFWQGFFLVVLSSLILKFSPVISIEILAYAAGGIFIVLFHKYLPWNQLINALVLIFVFTLIFYALFASDMILSWVFVKEIIYNLAAGWLIFTVLSKIKFGFR